MKEIHDIILAFENAQKEKMQTALATVVHIEGSSYRRPGARMLIREDGQLTGSISGGCLEGDTLRKALLVMMQQKAKLVTYDTSDEEEAGIGMGLGCNGIIQVLIEPIDPDLANNPIELLKAIVAKRQKAVFITLFSLSGKQVPQYGSCLLFTEDGNVFGNKAQWESLFKEDAREAFQSRQSCFKSYILKDQHFIAFIEMIKPAISLVIIGAGNDVLPLVEMAGSLGWQTTVVDGRPNYAKASRFISACQVLVSKPENALNQITIDDQTVFVLMTHNYNYDKAMLRILLKKEVAYIGMLGPAKKREKVLIELNESGARYSSQQLSVFHSPIGLDIAAETAEEIALSILAEIKVVLSGREGKSLRNFHDGIHFPSTFVIEEERLTSGQ